MRNNLVNSNKEILNAALILSTINGSTGGLLKTSDLWRKP